ncbi:alpha/beta hydrolase [Faecalibacterium sp. CLA-AA-H283]|nr:alpha/beta hydrolase [Faecalibacterium hominis (ex Afrizal et al. 2022)]
MEIFLPSRSSSSTQPVSILNLQALSSYFIIIPSKSCYWLTVYDKVSEFCAVHGSLRCCTRRKRKIRTLLQSETGSDFSCLVEVDRYRADERCTFIFTLNAYYSMFSGILRLYDPALLARVPKDLPLLFLAGDADPVGEQGAGVKRAVKSLLDAGVKNIEVKLYPSARHELLVELNREEVFADIGDWLERRL